MYEKKRKNIQKKGKILIFSLWQNYGNIDFFSMKKTAKNVSLLFFLSFCLFYFDFWIMNMQSTRNLLFGNKFNLSYEVYYSEYFKLSIAVFSILSNKIVMPILDYANITNSQKHWLLLIVLYQELHFWVFMKTFQRTSIWRQKSWRIRSTACVWMRVERRYCILMVSILLFCGIFKRDWLYAIYCV